MRLVNLTSAASVLVMVLVVEVALADENPGPESRGVRNSVLTPQQAISRLRAIGGVLIHLDDRKPDRPVILIDFTNHPKFREEWLQYVAAFPHLNTLGLSGTSLTDVGLKYLRNLGQLETLTLAETRVTDQGLIELKNLKNLRTLDLRDTRVTQSGVAMLRKIHPKLDVDFTATPGTSPVEISDSGQNTDQGNDSFVPLTAHRIRELRQRVTELTQPGDNLPPGWSKSRVDPGALVKIFAPMRLKEGYVLRAYQFYEEGNGNGVVWAMPESADFPAPGDSAVIEDHLFKAPKPWDALDDVMDAIEGDGSPSSYLTASLLRRELREFGALWHGLSWGTHVVLDDDPWSAGEPRNDEPPTDRPATDVKKWNWTEPRPTAWKPQVRIQEDRVTVTFYTYCGVWKESIVRHTDTYRRGKYRPRVEQRRIAEGPGGYAM